MKRFFAIGAALVVCAFGHAQDEDPFAGGDDTVVGEAPAPAAAEGAEAPGVGAGEAVAPPAGGVEGAPPALPPPSPGVAGDSMVFHEDLKQFEFGVTIAAHEAVMESLNAPSFALANKARGDIHPPRLTRQQVEAAIEQEVEQLIQSEFPDSRYDEIKEEAAADFKMWNVGDRVRVMARRGDKMVPFSGQLEFVTRTRIKVSNFPIAKEDIGKEYLPLLYRVEHERAVQRQVTRETRIFNDKRNAYGEEQRELLTPKMWYKAGYIRGRNNTWIARKKVFDVLYVKAKTKEYERVFKANRETVYLDNGWVFDPTLNRWLSPADQKPPEPVATAVESKPAETGAGGDDGGIFGALQNLLNKENENAPKDGGDDDLWDDEPKKPEAADGDPDKKTPTDDDELFGEE